MDEGLSPEDLVIVRLLPTIRLYDSAFYYMEGVKIEVKPSKIEQEYGTEVYWSSTEIYRFSVRYLTLTCMTMLHEYLKLCYISLEDPNFFPEPEHLSIHFFVTVGATVWQYIHTIGDRVAGNPIEYVSYNLDTFEQGASKRNRFRDRFNEVLVLQITTIKEAMENKVREVLALGPAEIRRRLESRTHQDVRFSQSKRSGKWGFSVEHGSPTPQMQRSSKACFSLRSVPQDSEAKLE